jgi:hypothetical protein
MTCVLVFLGGCFATEPDRGVGPLPPGYEPDKYTDGESGDTCADSTQCQPGKICFNKFCVGTGSLRVSLAFSTDSDFDLHVRTPMGSEIYYANPTADGGYLDVDQCVTPCGVGHHVENVFFEGSVSGRFDVFVVNFDGRGSGEFSIEVASAAFPTQTFTGYLNPPAGNPSQTFSFAL